MSWIQTRNTLTPYIPLTDEARPLYKYIYRRKFHNVLKTVPRRYLFTYLLWPLQIVQSKIRRRLFYGRMELIRHSVSKRWLPTDSNPLWS